MPHNGIADPSTALHQLTKAELGAALHKLTHAKLKHGVFSICLVESQTLKPGNTQSSRYILHIQGLRRAKQRSCLADVRGQEQ